MARRVNRRIRNFQSAVFAGSNSGGVTGVSDVIKGLQTISREADAAVHLPRKYNTRRNRQKATAQYYLQQASKIYHHPKSLDIGRIANAAKFMNGGWEELEKTFQGIVIDIDNDLNEKVKEWAERTLFDWKFIYGLPYDTGNLHNSAEILASSKTAWAGSRIYAGIKATDKNDTIYARVGINEQKILPPPAYKRSSKQHYASGAPKKIKMPNYNYAPFANKKSEAPGFLEKLEEIALNNMMEIF